MARARRTAIEVEKAILHAAWEELLEHGYWGVTFEGVARRAGTSKPVVYRRHASRPHLVFAAMEASVKEATSVPGTNSLRSDLIAWFEAARARAAEIGPSTYRALLGEADTDTLVRINNLISSTGGDLERDIVNPARARGEMGTQPLPPRVLALPAILMRDEILFGLGNEVAETVDQLCLPLLQALGGKPGD